MLCRVGCRIGEALGSHWSDFDLDNHKWEIKSTYSNSKITSPKNGKSRVVDLSPQLVEVLKTHRKDQLQQQMQSGNRSDIVFCRKGDYTRYHLTYNEWKRTLKRADMSYQRIHHLRHSVASLLIADGVDVKNVQRQLGHHSAQFTLDIYVKYMKQDAAITSTLDNGSASDFATST